ncbi:hypothetical protein Riv7116_3703 [Rivularia sp. PCC 7116]|uniref:outer membrane beta-barrel protein n=1 Tax=Rivularia sp. PCC 7116 TaxID=373994 RepID=UPI00029F38AA|nr:outer membrane beta-barrel protein [Rivularia sp. PCC 7116]AFY56149.1 hypothetical protein Riv7116_3703 [Rivularia sp. PCC 7116]
MRQFFKSVAKISTASSIACAVTFASALSASAQSEQGLDGHYVGGSFQTGSGITSLGIYGRYDFPKLPVSVRGSIAVIDNDNDTETFFQPAVTYDLPIGDKANAYAGAGLAFGSGDSTAFLNAGAETEIATNVVAFGDLIIPLDDDADTGFGIGLGYRF